MEEKYMTFVESHRHMVVHRCHALIDYEQSNSEAVAQITGDEHVGVGPFRAASSSFAHDLQQEAVRLELRPGVWSKPICARMLEECTQAAAEAAEGTTGRPCMHGRPAYVLDCARCEKKAERL